MANSTHNRLLKRFSYKKRIYAEDDKSPFPAPKRPHYVGRTWSKVKEFETRFGALDYMSKKRMWTFSNSQSTHEGFKEFYQCSQEHDGRRCPASLYLLYHAGRETTVSMFRSDDSHNHEKPAAIANDERPQLDVSSAIEYAHEEGGIEEDLTALPAVGDALPGKEKRCRGPAKIWTKEREFETPEEALEFVKHENTWSVRGSHDTHLGRKVMYRCNRVKRSRSCPAGIYLLYHSDRESAVSLFRNEDGHAYHNEAPSRGIPVEIRRAIENIYDEGYKTPKRIFRVLRDRKIPEPSQVQLQNFLMLHKKKISDGTNSGTLSVNIREFADWCRERSTSPSAAEMDKAFVVSYVPKVTNGAGLIRVLMSTPRLLDFGTHSSVLHAHLSFKLDWEGMPMVVIGTTDRDQRFHPIGLALTSGDAVADFEFVFRAVSEGVRKVFDAEYHPELLVWDTNHAISDGFVAVFGDQVKRIACWTQVKRAIDGKSKKISDEEKRKRIRDDIYDLQACESEAVFDAATKLFFTKWQSLGDGEIDQFLTYFQTEWIAGNKNWFEGCAPDAPKTNDALEAACARVKADGTFRNKLPLLRFLGLTTNLLNTWSRERDATKADHYQFFEAPTKSNALWKKAHQLSSEAMVLSKARGDGWRDFYISFNDHATLLPDVVNEYRLAFMNLDWNSFDEYAAMRNSLCVVSMFENYWESATCNCPDFLKDFICEHVLAVAIRNQLCDVPDSLKVAAGAKRKRGRPKRVNVID